MADDSLKSAKSQHHHSLGERSRITYFWDRFRGGFQGVVETCWQVFALLIAIRYFEADPDFKQLISVGNGLGLMLSPFSLILIRRSNHSISTIISFLWIGVAVSILSMGFVNSVFWFFLAIGSAQIFASQGIPLMTHIYNRNYHSKERGTKLSTTFIASSLTGIIFGFIGGRLLDSEISNYTGIMVFASFAAIGLACAVKKIPSEPSISLQEKNPTGIFSIIWNDKMFGVMLLAWSLMGFGNLMLVPIRVEYLADPAYGINASNTQISFILVSLVLFARLASTKIWGILFDRLNVITLRITVNLIFVVSIFLFFTFTHLWTATLGALLLGLAFGGGGIMWSLYVTKVAPPDKVTVYMSLHTFMAGLRTALSPILGYALLSSLHPTMIAWIAICLIASSTFLFLPMRKFFFEPESQPSYRM